MKKDYDDSKKNKKASLIVLLISMSLAAFLIFQTVQIIRYTLGDIDKKDAFLYNVIDNILKK